MSSGESLASGDAERRRRSAGVYMGREACVGGRCSEEEDDELVEGEGDEALDDDDPA